MAGLLILVGYYVWALCLRDPLQTNQCRKQIEKLTTTDISAITIGHQLIDRSADINNLLIALKASVPISNSERIRGCGLTLHLKNGTKFPCAAYRYKNHPVDAVLEFENPHGLRLQVPGLANAIDKLGAHLPESEYLDVSDETGKIRDGQISFAKPGTLPPHTLYNIQRAKDPVLASHDNNRAVVIFETFLLALAGLFACTLGRHTKLHLKKDSRLEGRQLKDLFTLSTIVVVAVGFAVYVFYSGSEFNTAARHYKNLRTLLEEGKCKMHCGKLTDIRYIVKDHGAVFLYMLQIDEHKFFFSRKTIDQGLYDAKSWKDWAPEQLQPGVRLCIWYADMDDIKGWYDPPEQIARIDVQ